MAKLKPNIVLEQFIIDKIQKKLDFVDGLNMSKGATLYFKIMFFLGTLNNSSDIEGITEEHEIAYQNYFFPDQEDEDFKIGYEMMVGDFKKYRKLSDEYVKEHLNAYFKKLRADFLAKLKSYDELTIVEKYKKLLADFLEFKRNFLLNENMIFYNKHYEKWHLIQEQLFETELKLTKDQIELDTKSQTSLQPPTFSTPNHQNLSDVLSVNKLTFLLEMLETLDITKNGKNILTERKKGLLRGTIDALNAKSFFSIGQEKFTELVQLHIQMQPTKLNASRLSESARKRASNYLNNYWKS